MAVIAFRPRREPDDTEPPAGKHPPLAGTFRSPTGASGVFAGSLRVERLLLTPHGAYVRGVVTGLLRDADGSPVASVSRTVTVLAQLHRVEGRTVVGVGAFDVDLMGLSVRMAPVDIDPHFAIPRRPTVVADQPDEVS